MRKKLVIAGAAVAGAAAMAIPAGLASADTPIHTWTDGDCAGTIWVRDVYDGESWVYSTVECGPKLGVQAS